MKYAAWRLLRRFGLDVRPAKNARDIIDFIDDRKIDLVLDVGGNVGQFGRTLRAKEYRGKIVSFEPVESVFRDLLAQAKADGNWEANNFALGATSGEAKINISVSSVFNSILTSTREATLFDQTAEVKDTEVIQVRTLDEIAPNLLGNVLLKIDTQGFEKQVLEGGKKTLPHLKGILMELPIVHLYKGNWEFHEAIEFMANSNFVPAQIHPVNYLSTDTMSLVEVDCLFRPR